MLKIATWNVNSLRVRLPHVLMWWETAQPDVLCLQETKMENAQFPHEAFRQLGLHTACHGQKSYNGVALVSRFPLEEVSTGFGGEDYESQARILAATVAPPQQESVRVISAYVPNGESLSSPKFEFKKNFYAHLQSYVLQELNKHKNLVLAGDFNVAADERDVANPTRAAKEVLFTPQEREWLSALQSATGLTDALRQVNQEAGQYTWWDYRTFARNPVSGMRIDYTFVSKDLESKVQEVHQYTEERTKPQPSDHIPVMLTLAPA